ncbi:unnamed protein product [Closterium sp. NIES-64]|nr:unnamed protein product [Closterium sp. NIES-64]
MKDPLYTISPPIFRQPDRSTHPPLALLCFLLTPLAAPRHPFPLPPVPRARPVYPCVRPACRVPVSRARARPAPPRRTPISYLSASCSSSPSSAPPLLLYSSVAFANCSSSPQLIQSCPPALPPPRPVPLPHHPPTPITPRSRRPLAAQAPHRFLPTASTTHLSSSLPLPVSLTSFLVSDCPTPTPNPHSDPGSSPVPSRSSLRLFFLTVLPVPARLVIFPFLAGNERLVAPHRSPPRAIHAAKHVLTIPHPRALCNSGAETL